MSATSSRLVTTNRRNKKNESSELIKNRFAQFHNSVTFNIPSLLPPSREIFFGWWWSARPSYFFERLYVCKFCQLVKISVCTFVGINAGWYRIVSTTKRNRPINTVRPSTSSHRIIISLEKDIFFFFHTTTSTSTLTLQKQQTKQRETVS